MTLKFKLTFIFLLAIFISCNSSDLIEIIDGVERKPIDVSRMGINAFGNDSEFGTPCQQFLEVKRTLGLRYLRLLINWNDSVQPTPSSAPNFSFYDDLIECLPAGTEALLVINGLPSWMSSPANWPTGNIRSSFVELWYKKVIRRYRGNARVTAFQVWNEPNMVINPENVLLGIESSPSNYLEMLALAYSVTKDLASDKLVVNAATTAINQDYRATLNYNKTLREQGIENFIDVYAFHFYGEQYERVVDNDGVADFLNSINKRLWITESGEQGVNRQLSYVEKVWPYLDDKISRIDRFYYYQFTSLSSPEAAYGLKNPSTSQPVSDLYVFLRDREK